MKHVHGSVRYRQILHVDKNNRKATAAGHDRGGVGPYDELRNSKRQSRQEYCSAETGVLKTSNLLAESRQTSTVMPPGYADKIVSMTGDWLQRFKVNKTTKPLTIKTKHSAIDKTSLSTKSPPSSGFALSPVARLRADVCVILPGYRPRHPRRCGNYVWVARYGKLIIINYRRRRLTLRLV